MKAGPGFDISTKAGADLNTTTSDWEPVYVNSSNSVLIANSITHRVVGILQRRPKAGTGSACNVRMLGLSKLTVHDTCTAGDMIMIGSGGAVRATAVSNTAATLRSMIGRALDASAASGTVIDVFLNPFTMQGTLTVTFD